MFQAMKFIPTGFNNNVTVRAARIKPFKSLTAAIKSIERTGLCGYVKQQGQSCPVWHNIKVN